MKPVGKKKIRTKVAGHQNCAICHPEQKSGKARDGLMSRREKTVGLADYEARLRKLPTHVHETLLRGDWKLE